MRSLFGAAALVLALLGQASTLVHLYVVHHELCREHGQLVEQDGEHCAVALTPAEPFEAPALVPLDAPVHTIVEAPLEAPPQERARTVLHVAPKTSPPLA